jgi:NDP-sugar pyrophosphorylase family protein
MAPVAGKPFLEWVLRYLVRQGITEAILSTGYLAETVAEHFRSQPVTGLHIGCLAEKQPLGTGGGFVNARNFFGRIVEAWLVLNGDSLIFADLQQAVRQLSDPAVDGVVIGRAVPDAARYGTLALRTDRTLLGFEEKRPGRGVINAGVYLFKDSLVREFPAKRPLSFEKDVFPDLVRRGFELKVCVTDAPFLDIGTPESLKLAEAFVQQNRVRL